MTRAPVLAMFIAAGATLPGVATGYEIPTHQELTDFAVGISNLAQTSLRRRLGIESIMNKELFNSFQRIGDKKFADVNPTCDVKVKMTLPQLLACGAMYEDVP